VAELRRTWVPTSGIVFSGGTTGNSLAGQAVPTWSVGLQLSHAALHLVSTPQDRSTRS
jgi:hypothetical protein